MDFLVQFYLISASKSSLRLCAKVRADAFDWTTALHTFQQSIPIGKNENNSKYHLPEVKPDSIDYLEKEKLINHSELLADGVRYTLYAGLYSGHGMDISAGKTVWSYLLKHHHALCGGTTGNPYLNGNTADQIVNNYAIAAWIEALAAQMILPDFKWAADEMVRIVFNGLEECLNSSFNSDTQRINLISETIDPITDPVYMCARFTRAVSSVYSHAVTLTEKGIRINYLLQGKYLLMLNKQAIVLKTEYDKILIQTKLPFYSLIEVFLPSTCQFTINLVRKNRKIETSQKDLQIHNGYCISLNTEWHNQDIINICPEEKIICESTHHQGIAFFYFNRLMCMPVTEQEYARAICSDPVFCNNTVTVMTAVTDKWKSKGIHSGDIPVLPVTFGDPVSTELLPYSSCKRRITMFPRAR